MIVSRIFNDSICSSRISVNHSKGFYDFIYVNNCDDDMIMNESRQSVYKKIESKTLPNTKDNERRIRWPVKKESI